MAEIQVNKCPPLMSCNWIQIFEDSHCGYTSNMSRLVQINMYVCVFKIVNTKI